MKGPRISGEQRDLLDQPYTAKEVKEALWSIDGDKAPAPDGYERKFYKDAWDIIGSDVTEGVLEFFKTGQLLKGINNTVIILIPKSIHGESEMDYRPISCCNKLYKIISKMVCKRLQKVLPEIISNTQSAFVAGRSIVQNIMICKDLLWLYNRLATTKSCLIKIDDNVEWKFVEEM